MQAVILAAGVGKRLKPLTDDLPKPMVRVNGRPILEYTLSILPKEIDEVILIVGYLKEKIIEYFGDSFKGVPIRYVEQKAPLGMSDALNCAKPFLKSGDFLVMVGDDLYHPDDLRDIIHTDSPAMLVKETNSPEKFGVCVVENGYLIKTAEKSLNPPSNLANIGVYLLNEGIFKVSMVQLPNGEFNLPEQIGLWAQDTKVHIVEARFWHPIGYPEDVEIAHSLVALPSELRVN